MNIKTHGLKFLIKNFINDFKLCNYVAMTYAPPGQGGYHHVNCQPKEYWIENLKPNMNTHMAQRSKQQYLKDNLVIIQLG